MPCCGSNDLTLVDTHVHLGEEDYNEDLHRILDDAKRGHVDCMIVPATDTSSWSRVLRLAEEHPQLLPALGLQPHDAKEYTPGLMEELRRHRAEIIAVGEIGLDFHYDLSPRPIQIEAFRAQLQAARALSLPVIMHCRDADAEFLSILREEGVPQGGVVHCCTCGWDTVGQFLDLGLYIGVTGMVTFKNLRAVHTIARECPADRLLLETDGPYLAPVPHRGQRNEPAYVRCAARAAAELRGITEEEICRLTTQNAIRLFGPRLSKALVL